MKLQNYPIAKNLLSLSMQYMINHRQSSNFYPEITNEIFRINAGLFNREDQKKWASYEHWIWGSWFDYFSNPEVIDETKFKDSEVPSFSRPSSLVQDFHLYLKSIFQPKEELLKEYNKLTILSTSYLTNIQDKKMIGCHVRRGDAARKPNQEIHGADLLLTNLIANEKLSSSEEYIRIIKQYDPNEYYVYIASDSIETVVEEFKESIPEYTLCYSESSKLVPETIGPPHGHLEVHCFLNPDTAFDTCCSGIVDLYNLSLSDVFIGPISISAYSNCAAHLVSDDTKVMDIKSNSTYIRSGIPFNLVMHCTHDDAEEVIAK